MRTAAITLALSATVLLAAACAGAAPATTPLFAAPSASAAAATGSPELSVPPAASAELSPTASLRHGPQGLFDDLVALGRDAEIADSAAGEPLASEQLIVCTGGEEIRVFSYASDLERSAVSAQIDPDDPSHVGTSIVEWAGSPKFWQRDRIIVLYLGSDESTIEALTTLMGQPFAQGEGRPPQLPSPC